MGILDAPGYSRAQANDRFAGIGVPRLGVFGDSISQYDTLWDSAATYDFRLAYSKGSHSRGIYANMNAYLGRNRFRMVFNSGIAGNTTEQMLARIKTDVLDIPSDWVAVLAGANDSNQGWPATRTIAALTSIYDQILADGRKLLISTMMPKTSANTQTLKDQISLVNQFIKDYARSHKNVVIADLYAAFVEPATGEIKAGLTDGTHPLPTGAALGGKVLADIMRPFTSAWDVFPGSNVDLTSIANNPMGTGTTGTLVSGLTGTLPSNWQATAGDAGTMNAVASKVTLPGDVMGEWTQITLGAGHTAQINLIASCQSAGSKWTQGDTLMVALEIDSDDNWTSPTVLNLEVSTTDNTFKSHDLYPNLALGPGNINPGRSMLLIEGYVPTTGSIRVTLKWKATAGTLRFRRLAVKKQGV